MARAARGPLTALLAAGLLVVAACAWTAPGEASSTATSPTPSASASPSPTVTASPSPGATAFPAAAAVEKARRWLSRRAGYVAFAVIDSAGRLRGWNPDRRFVSGSVTKAILLVSYLRSHRTLSAYERHVLTQMIEVSDIDAADVIYARTGRDAGLREIARLSGMRRFVADRGFWGYATITAADQARFFLGMQRLIPKRHRAFARTVLSGIIGWQSYGIARAGRHRGWRVYFKGGWRSGLHGGRLIHQIARLEKKDVVIAVAVLTDGQPTRKYARETIEGVAVRLLTK